MAVRFDGRGKRPLDLGQALIELVSAGGRDQDAEDLREPARDRRIDLTGSTPWYNRAKASRAPWMVRRARDAGGGRLMLLILRHYHRPERNFRVSNRTIGRRKGTNHGVGGAVKLLPRLERRSARRWQAGVLRLMQY